MSNTTYREAKRLELHELLVSILGSRNVYFQPPENVKINYPAIIYSRVKINNKYANNLVYNQQCVYQIVVVDKDPDSIISESISKILTISHENNFTKDGLHHDVYRLYY